MFRQSNFRGYRSHPIYLEKVNNFTNAIKAKGAMNESRTDEMVSQYEDHDPYASSSSLRSSKRDQVPSSAMSSRTASRQQGYQPVASSRSNAFQPEQPSSRQQGKKQPQQPESRKVTSSDLRNKRSQVSNQQYQGFNQGGKQTTYSNNFHAQPASGSFAGGRGKGASYRVNLAIGSGAYQADQF